MRKSKRLDLIPPYLFAQIDKKREALKTKGVDIIDLGIGDPDQPTPNFVLDYFYSAVKDKKTHHYPPYEGTLEFREAVAQWYEDRFGVMLNPHDEVICLIGSKEGIAHLFFSFVDDGDLTLVSDPGYPVYKIGTLLAGGKYISLPLLQEDNFLPDLDKLESSLLEKIKLVFVNYPNNPTAAVCDLSFYEKLIHLAKKYDFLVCSDLAYSEITFDGFIAPSLLQIPGAKDFAIEFHSFSKMYNMAGWRIGMAAGNKEAIKALLTIKTNIDSGTFAAIQKASALAFKDTRNSRDFIKQMNTLYQKRRDIFVEGLNNLGWTLLKPKGSFFVWAKVPHGFTSISFAEELLEKTGVLVVPGSGYGQYGEGYFRAALTLDEEKIKDAIERMRSNNIIFKS